MDVFFGFVILACGFVIYFIPSIVASQRDHKSSSGVLLLNLFLGWTFVGWVAALVWAASGEPAGAPKEGTEAAMLSNSRACPECAEKILKAAKKCKHCGAPVEPVLETW